MANQSRYYPVNWIDGMKINKDHFLSQDNASQYALQQAASVGLSPLRFGILPVHQTGDPNFEVKISLDNQKTLRVAVLNCQAMLLSGVVVSLPALGVAAGNQTDGVPATTFTFDPQGADATWWVVLMVHPFEKQPVGKPDLDENPPRLPYLAPTYKIEVVSDSQYRQYATNPYSLTIGKVQVLGSDIRVDDYYIPPCYSVSAHPDLVALHSEFDQFMGSLEMKCSQIVQKIYSRNQQNDLSELVLFVCDRIILYLGQSITYARWIMLHDSPAMLFAHIASLARIMKNSMDLRAGSGKEEMLNYLSEWSELKQGELESLLNSLATMRYNNNDVNANIQPIVVFVKVISKLFDTLSKLEFIGKKKESGIFVNEERNMSTSDNSQNKPKRRFFG